MTHYSEPEQLFVVSDIGNFILAFANTAQRYDGDFRTGYMSALSDLANAIGATEWVIMAQYSRDALLRSSPQGRAWRQATAAPTYSLAGVQPDMDSVPRGEVADLLRALLGTNEELAAQHAGNPTVESYRHGFAAALAAVAVGFGLPVESICQQIEVRP